MTTDVTNVQNAYQMVIRIAVRTPLMIIFSMVMSLSINVRMALVFLALIPILAVVLFRRLCIADFSENFPQI